MSENLDKIEKQYKKNVLSDHQPLNFGLFSIPEYPEYERGEEGMWSAALDTILTTLRYLAPATLITLFWGHQSFLFRILKHIDLAIRSIFSSDEQKESLLKWLAEAGPARVEHLDTVWRHGWILCGVLDGAMPGACAGHPPTRQTLKHAQTIADHYLGVDPVFSQQEFESDDYLSRHQEWKLTQYLDQIRQAIMKIPPQVSRPIYKRSSSTETTQFTVDYVARGSGLTAAQINNKVYFKIYPTAQQSLEPGEITIDIRGPKDTYGKVIVPPILGKAQKIRQTLLNLEKKTNFTENALPITQGATYLRTFGHNDMNRTFHIPKTKYDIDIDVETSDECARIGYVVTDEGRYEISILSRGLSIVGSPFSVKATQNIIGVLERESFCLEDGEEIDIVDVNTDRKVVLRIVDFVTEKMLLKENGALEKITDDEIDLLMTTENVEKINMKENPSPQCEQVETYIDDKTEDKNIKFKESTMKVIVLLKSCKVFKEILHDKKESTKHKEKKIDSSLCRPGIPDIVNSTFDDSYKKRNEVQQSYENYMKSENIPKCTVKEKAQFFTDITASNVGIQHIDRDIKIRLTTMEIENNTDTTSSPNNPFFEQNVMTETVTGSHINESNQQNTAGCVEQDNIPIKILIEEDNKSISPTTNPFIDPYLIERPKTPVLKIITGEVQNREDSVYIDQNTERITEEMLRLSLNPLFLHRQQASFTEIEDSKADFIIGAPVSLSPIVNLSSNNHMDFIMSKDNHDGFYAHEDDTKKINEVSPSVFSKPLHTRIEPNVSSTFHSLDSNIQEQIKTNYKSNFNNYEDLMFTNNTTFEGLKRDRDTWDSAYVSIDELNNSPDGNNNDETASKSKFSLGDGTSLTHEEYLNMGPAERDLWESCTELNNNVPKINKEIRSCKYDKRLTFTPILEENDKNFFANIKTQDNVAKANENDLVRVAFAELNEIFQEYISDSEHSSITLSCDDKIAQSTEFEYPVQTSDIRVESASESESDVMRPTTTEEEGAISEVQANVTESVSASQSLHIITKDDEQLHEYTKDHTQFGENKNTNIVSEKKKYWDEKIREIEEKKSAEPKKKKLISKNLRQNDSLSKRRGKQMVKNFLTATESGESVHSTSFKEPIKQQRSYEEVPIDCNLVEKWKKYWDEKLKTEVEETQVTCFKIKPYKAQESPSSIAPVKIEEKANDVIGILEQKGSDDSKIESENLPVKQELPEEIFKAFETSPKRFFGTSRKRILNKIDSFLGKPSTTDNSLSNNIGASLEKGIVSSRISLFHNKGHVEEFSKSQSLHNIHQSAHSEKNLFHPWPNPHSVEISKCDNDTISPALIEKLPKSSSLDNDSPNLENKRLRMSNTSLNRSFDESLVAQRVSQLTPIKKQESFVQKKIKDMNKETEKKNRFSKIKTLQKNPVSRSEMDIFYKTSTEAKANDMDKHKSCEELPKINVKDFINMYETVTETAKVKSKPLLPKLSTSLEGSEKFASINSSISGADKISPNNVCKIEETNEKHDVEDFSIMSIPKSPLRIKRSSSNETDKESLSMGQSFESYDDVDDKKLSDTSPTHKVQRDNTMEKTYVSLLDIDLEIIESSKSPEPNIESTTEQETESHPIDYKSRFKMAKQYFQSLEELTVEEKKSVKVNECQKLLYNLPDESPESGKFKKKIKNKSMKKSHSMPSSVFSKILRKIDTENEGKLVKISDKFNIDDLFADVTEGKLSRQGSLRGIPHMKAVLEALNSMENVSDTNISSYKLAISQMTEFAKENKNTNAQTYLSEYPYLPTTDPSKYHSRLDTNASGLISMKELLNKKPRRNSVPDLRLNSKFIVDL